MKCGKIFSINSSPRVDTANGKKWTVNLAAVSAQMSTGGGLTTLNTTLAHMDVPGMQKECMPKLKNFLAEMMQQLVLSMKTVAEEEKPHAISSNNSCRWGLSKRSHKHTYNAKSGVAVIFGHHTKDAVYGS